MLRCRSAVRACWARVEARAKGTVLFALAMMMLALAPRAEAALATYRLTAGSATFGLALPQGAATPGVTVGTLQTQTDVKTRWPDGSIRFAVVSVQVPSTGNYDIEPSTATQGSHTPAWPTASVNFTINGQVYTAPLPAFNGNDSWLNGPVAREARAIVSPALGGTPHPLLQVIYDVRSYAAGGHRIDVTVQNVKDIAAGDQVTYDVSVTVGNSTVWSKSGVTQYYLTRWRKAFSAGGLVQSLVTPDFEPFHAAKALPRFLQSVENKFYDTNTADFDILKYGTMAPYMMTPGGRAEIGPYPFWVAQYVIHKGQSQLDVMLKHGDMAGSWSMNITEPDGTSVISLQNYPGYWLDGRATRGHPGGAEAPRAYDGKIRGVAPDPSSPDNQHLPSLTYVPYLVTGDRYYIDQSKLWAAWSLIYTYPGDSMSNGVDFGRHGGDGILVQNGTRGMAWPLRNLVDTAAYLPDNDPAKPYLASRLQKNLDWLEWYATNRLEGPLDFVFWDRGNGTGQGANWYDVSIWQQAYLAWAVDHAKEQGFGPADNFRNRCIKTQVLFLTSGSAGYPPQYGAPYYPRVARKVDGVVQHFANMAEVFYYNHGDGSGYAANDTQPGHRLPQPINGYYGPEARLLLTMGVREGIPGAVNALNWLMSYTDGGGGTVLADVNRRSGFAVAVPGSSTTPVGTPPGPPRNLRIISQ
jgi:hypothetical protein